MEAKRWCIVKKKKERNEIRIIAQIVSLSALHEVDYRAKNFPSNQLWTCPCAEIYCLILWFFLYWACTSSRESKSQKMLLTGRLLRFKFYLLSLITVKHRQNHLTTSSLIYLKWERDYYLIWHLWIFNKQTSITNNNCYFLRAKYTHFGICMYPISNSDMSHA